MTFHTYKKIKALGSPENEGIFIDGEDEIVIEEKMDGANFRFMVTNEGNIIFGSRTQQLTSDKGEYTNIEKNFIRCIEYVKTAFSELCEDVLEKSKGKIFYGENMVRHSMDYDWEKIPTFLGFDIYDLGSNKFINIKNRRNLFSSWNLNIVPLIKICKVKDITKVNDDSVPISFYASPSSKDQQAEGIVFKNYNKQIFAKYVREKFKEKNREMFGDNKKHASNDNEYFSAVYCTNARIDKCIFKLIDEGNELDMKLMHKLPNFVYEDIWEENWKDIIHTKKIINFKNFKSLISKRCLEVLKQMMINNSLQ